MSRIDPNSPVPLYYQLKTLILEDIARGAYKPGEQLPTEHQLCEEYGISRTPVHRALAELAAEGVIFRERRRGTFVNPHWAPRRSTGKQLRVVMTDETLADHIEARLPVEVSVNVATVDYAEMRSALTASVAEGRAPDIAFIDTVWIADLAEAGFLLPLDEIDPQWIASDYESDFVEALVEGQRYDGHVYAIPEEINVAGLWLRLDYLESIGAAPPETWEDMSRIADGLQANMPPGGHVLAMPGGHVAGETTTYCLLAVLASNGVGVLNGDITLDSGATVEALRFLRRFIDTGAMTPDVVAFDWLRSPHLLGSGLAAMSVGGSYEAAKIAEAAGVHLDDLTDHFVFAPFPAGPRGAPATLTGAMAYSIPRQSADPARALQLIEHIVTPENLAARARGRPTIPPRRSAIQVMANESPFVAETAEMLSTAVMRPAIPDYHLVTVQLQNMLQAVLTGRHRPAAAAERTAEMVSAITGLPVRHG